ncbi:MAG: hypothetical protein IT532_09315 [Burkholderiales bacterium]|nr:hypothetical protein [Burkholderiales bacterium]
MSVLAEALSVLVENRILTQRYPGGVEGFARDCPSAGFCSDGRISRVGFLSPRDTRFFLGVLEACGLHCGGESRVPEVAIVDQNVGLLHPCLWLESGHAQGIPLCWHAAHRPGRLVIPRAWSNKQSEAFEPLPDVPFPRLMRFLRTEDRLDWYQNRRTGELVYVDSPFVTH